EHLAVDGMGASADRDEGIRRMALDDLSPVSRVDETILVVQHATVREAQEWTAQRDGGRRRSARTAGAVRSEQDGAKRRRWPRQRQGRGVERDQRARGRAGEGAAIEN